MGELLPIPFGSLSALDDPHLLTLAEALTASNCYLDTKAVTGRNGYRSALVGAIVGVGTPQLEKRFRPSAASERVVVVIGGDVYLITEPSSETASDATASKIGTGTFGANDNISGADLASNFYLVSDNATPVAARILSDYTLHVLTSLPTPAAPTSTLGTFTVTLLDPLSKAFTGGGSLVASGVTDWKNLNGAIGCTVTYQFGVTYNWANTKWLMVMISPETISGGGGTCRIEIGNTGNTFVPLAVVYDPPNTNGSPFCVFCNMQGLDTTVTGAATQIRFTNVGPDTGPATLSAFMPIPTPPEAGTVSYYLTYFNSVTGVESALSMNTDVIYNNAGVTPPQFHAARNNYNTTQDLGQKSSNPDTMTNSDCFNKGAGLALPASSDFAPVRTFSGTVDVNARFPLGDTVRLYRSTANGISLVKTSNYTTRADGSAWTTGTGTNSDLPPGATFWVANVWTIVDDTGAGPLANAVYKAGGPFPRLSALVGVSQRLAGIYQNRVYISSFTPTSDTSNPVPQWPAIAIEPADGWSFDISAAPTEIGYTMTAEQGDALYIGTSEAVRSMNDLTPGSLPFAVMRRGVLGRQAAIYAEEQYIWASYDGIYMAANQANVTELTQSIRNYYINTFSPTSAVVLAYQSRKLFAFQGTTYIRYDFVRKNWTTGTLADTVDFAAFWTSASPPVEQLWLLCASRLIGRWQASATRDMEIGTDITTGTLIPPWSFSTGFDAHGVTSAITGVMLDANGVVKMTAAKTVAGIPVDEARFEFIEPVTPQVPVYAPGWPDFRAYKFRFQFDAANAVTLFRSGRVIEPILEGHGG